MAEKTLSKEEWARVEKALSGYYGIVKMQIDCREVAFQRQMAGKNRLTIVTYVDGSLKGAWVGSQNEHQEQRYLRPVSKFAFKPESRKRLKKNAQALSERTRL